METKVSISVERYDDLLHKEKYLEILLAGMAKLSGYANVTEFKKFMGVPFEEEEKEVQ